MARGLPSPCDIAWIRSRWAGLRPESNVDASLRCSLPSASISTRQTQNVTRNKILRCALRIFADCGYAGASVQAIVNGARVTKPALYYHFESKAGLFQALIDWAHDERYRVICEAADRARDFSARLTEVMAAQFEFISRHRELMRIAFAT